MMLTLDELGKLIGLLARYQKDLIYEAHEGLRLDEDPHDIEVRELAIEHVDVCLKTIVDDFNYRLTT